MPNNDFFQDTTMDDQNQSDNTTEVFKIGDKEYSQDQLERLVGLGEIGQELETKWNTKIDRIYPEFTKKSQELDSLKDQMSRNEQEKLNTKISSGDQLSPEEIRRQAVSQARDLGLVAKEDVASMIQEYISGYSLLNEINSFITDQTSQGNPKTTQQDLLNYMQESGLKDPKRAYKLMFEEELDRIKEKKVQSLRQPGIYTERSSTAGAKQPAPEKITKANLDDALIAALRGGGQ